MRRFPIPAAIIALATAAAIAATPALARDARHMHPAAMPVAQQGPGGCEGFNRALTEAVATQIRTGRHAEARRLMGLFQACAAR